MFDRISDLNRRRTLDPCNNSSKATDRTTSFGIQYFDLSLVEVCKITFGASCTQLGDVSPFLVDKVVMHDVTSQDCLV